MRRQVTQWCLSWSRKESKIHVQLVEQVMKTSSEAYENPCWCGSSQICLAGQGEAGLMVDLMVTLVGVVAAVEATQVWNAGLNDYLYNPQPPKLRPSGSCDTVPTVHGDAELVIPEEPILVRNGLR